MSEKQAVVYTAQDKQQAHVLRNLLEEAGIKAAVTGDPFSAGTDDDAAARVVVAEEDAEEARRLAEELERQGGIAPAPAESEDDEDEGLMELAEWPTCPECSARRTTTCPVCQTSGTDFPQADARFAGSLKLEKGAAPMSCGCGSGACSSGAAKSRDASAPVEADADKVEEAAATDDAAPSGEDAQEEPRAPRLVLTCTTCDEPFVPEHARRCEWCGHEFPDGYPVDVVEGPPEEELPTRALVVMIGLGVLAIAAIAYFLMLVPGS